MGDVLADLLEKCKLKEHAEKVGESMYRLRWGEATIITGTAGEGIVVIAPMFDAPPDRERERFFRRLLEINAEIGGTAGFALQHDGAIVLQVGRGLSGLDAGELSLMLAVVGKFADDYGRRLREEFYGE